MTSIFLRSYAADIKWVPYALRSIHKFVTGISEIIISVPQEDFDRFKSLSLTREKLMMSKVATAAMDPYLGQQYDKLIADQYTNADMILYWDSDVIAIRQFEPYDLTVVGEPRCLMTPYSKLVDSNGAPATPWQPIVQKALGHPVQYEYMRSHPFLVPRAALQGFRDYMLATHGKSLGAYISEQPNRSFSEFNCIMAWAHHHQPDLFFWWNTEELGVPQPFVKQRWSYSGLTDDERAEMEKELA